MLKSLQGIFVVWGCASNVECNTSYRIGQNNIQISGFDFHNPVFWLAATFSVLFIVLTLLFPQLMKSALTGLHLWCVDTFYWLYMSASNVYVLFCVLMIILPVGKIRLGGEGAKTEYSTLSWFSMLSLFQYEMSLNGALVSKMK
ncbi:BCCT family transporter [Endozoicomonas ascidiicola]|uniref:BCCT family transporter n=1 Tax=Endozoicomonas ascidiicola TaxID=1698521 RepID=UPI0008352D25|nr:BCCT family transporter [Endozoicomonas ascidiicola]